MTVYDELDDDAEAELVEVWLVPFNGHHDGPKLRLFFIFSVVVGR